MNSLSVEKKYQLSKWADIVKACKSSGMRVSEWLAQNNISKDQYYYWQRKVKDACLESMQMEQTTFVELPVEVPQVDAHMPVIKKATIKAKAEFTVENTLPVATLKLDGVSMDIYDNASPQFIKSLAEAFLYVK